MKRIFALITAVSIICANIVCSAAEEKYYSYSYDFNDGSLENVIRYQATVGSIRNQDYYVGSHIRIKDKSKDGKDKYVELGEGEGTNPQFMLAFPQVLYGKVIVEGDFKADNLTPTRNLFSVFSHDEQELFELRCQGYYYQLFYDRTNTDVFEIPINDEWHTFRAVIDTDESKFNVYIDGTPCFVNPVDMNRGANAKLGVSGVKSAITYNFQRGENSGTTGIDNIKAYTVSKEKYTGYSSQTLDFDYECNTVSGAVKGNTVGEFLSKIAFDDSGANAEVLESGSRVKADDEYLYVGDELVITNGYQKEFISIHLDDNDSAEYFMMIDSPEIFHDGRRMQIDDNNAEVKPMEHDGKVFVPVSVVKKLFGAEIKTNRDTGEIIINYNQKELKLNSEYYGLEEMCTYFDINCKISNNGLIMLGDGSFDITGKEEYIENMFLFRNSKNQIVINANGNINAALEKAKEEIKKGDVTIELASQTYDLRDTINITSDIKCGTNKLTIKGNKENRAKLTGGIKLTSKDFEKIPDTASIKKRLPQISADKVVAVNLKKLGIDDLGRITPQGHTFEIKPSEVQLYCNGDLQTMARYPNEGFVYSGNVLHSGYGNPSEGFGENEFKYTDKRVENWKIDENTWMFGFWNNEYTNSQAKLKSINKDKQSIIIEGSVRSAMMKNNRPYYYFNVLEELDRPGEYFIDFNTGMLYYYPNGDLNDTELYLSVSDKTLLNLDKAENIVIENIDFEYCRNIGVKENKCKNVLIKNCGFTGIGTYGVLQRACVNSGLYGCGIYQTGAHGVMLEGGNYYNLTSSGNFVINSSFREHGTRRKTYSGAILCRGAGNYIYRNSFRDGYHMGIYVFGSNHYIKNNSFSNMCYMSGDAGCIYMANSWYTANTAVIGNYFENMSPHPEVGAGGNVAVYYDNSTSHTTTYGNIMYDTVYGIQSNCGRENKISGNIMSDMKKGVGIIGAATNAAFMSTYDSLRMIPYNGKIWKKSIPKMSVLEYNYNPTEPVGSDAYNNLWENSNDFSVTKPKVSMTYNNVSNNSSESLFMDKENKDFRIKNQSNYINTYIDGDIDYSLMGTGKDFCFRKNKELERVFIKTDTSESNQANIYLPSGDFVSAYITARDIEGNVIEDKLLNVKYKSDSSDVSVSENGTIYAMKNGHGTITALVTFKGKTIETKLNVYTDKSEWEAVNVSLSDRPVKIFYNDKILELKNQCKTDMGILIMPANEILAKMGYTQSGYKFTKDGFEIEFSPNSMAAKLNGKEITMIRNAYEENGELYVPFSIFEDMGILNIYSDAAKTAYIYNVNLAGGDEKIPENAKMVKLSEFIGDTGNWTADTTARYENNGKEIRFGQDSLSGKNCVLGLKSKKLENNTMLEFECEWNTDTFISMAFRIGDPTVIPWRENGINSYYFIVKSDSIELQKRVNDTNTFIVDNVPNTYFTPGKNHKVSVGITDTEKGPRAILNVDGHNIIDVTDSINYSVSGNVRTITEPLAKITEQGYASFVVYSTSAKESEAYMKLK